MSGAISSRNDISRIGKCHPGSVLVPAVFAAAEEYHLTGRQIMKGVLASYETMIRYGNTLRHIGLSNCYRGTAIMGPMAAAIAVATAMDLDVDQIASAGSFAIHNGFGLNEWAWAGTGEDVFQNGWAAKNGLLAAKLAATGIPGAKTIFEGPCGLLNAFGGLDKADFLTEELGTHFYIMDVRFKEISACINVQTAGQLAQRMAFEHDIDPHAIESVVIHVSNQSKTWPGCDNTDVHSLVQAIMSIQFCVSQGLVHRNCAQIDWTPPYDSDVQALIRKCTLVEESDFTEKHYHKQSCKIDITFKNGTTICGNQDDVVSLTPEQVLAIFNHTIDRFFGPEVCTQILDQLLHMEEVTDIRSITQLLHTDT